MSIVHCFVDSNFDNNYEKYTQKSYKYHHLQVKIYQFYLNFNITWKRTKIFGNGCTHPFSGNAQTKLFFSSTDVFPKIICKRQLYSKERGWILDDNAWRGQMKFLPVFSTWAGATLFRRWILNVGGGLECSIRRLLELFECDAESPSLPPPHFSQNLFRVARQGPSQGVIGFDFVTDPGPT